MGPGALPGMGTYLHLDPWGAHRLIRINTFW